LIAAATAVNEQQLILDELKRKLSAIQQLGTPLDKLQRAVVLAEHVLTKLISEYTQVVTNDLVVQRFGQEVAIQNLPPATKQEVPASQTFASLAPV
jgi:hypothetical protein